MGQQGSDTYDSTHRLVVQECTDTSCARYLRSTTVASGYRAAGVPSLTLRGTYRTSALGVRAVMLVATSDHHGVNGVSWFDNVSFHP